MLVKPMQFLLQPQNLQLLLGQAAVQFVEQAILQGNVYFQFGDAGFHLDVSSVQKEVML